MELSRLQALDLLRKYNKDPFHLRHALTGEAVMGWVARELGYGAEASFWSSVGLLHDLDFELWPEEHCVKSQVLMREHGLDEALIHATASHGWGLACDVKPEHEMERCSSPATSSRGSSARRPSCGPPKAAPIWSSSL